jgi:hypothetical protein
MCFNDYLSVTQDGGGGGILRIKLTGKVKVVVFNVTTFMALASSCTFLVESSDHLSMVIFLISLSSSVALFSNATKQFDLYIWHISFAPSISYISVYLLKFGESPPFCRQLTLQFLTENTFIFIFYALSWGKPDPNGCSFPCLIITLTSRLNFHLLPTVMHGE